MGRWNERLRASHRGNPALFRARILGIVVLLWLLQRLVFDDNPWTGGIAERLAEGRSVRPIDYARTYGWWTAAANLGIVLALLATARRWIGSRTPLTDQACCAASRDPHARWFALVVGAAIATSAVLGWPRLSHGLWDDERYTVTHVVDGHYLRTAEGGLEFQPASWRDTFWYYKNPNNQVPYSILARLSLAAWRAVARPQHHFVREDLYRLPAYLAGLAGIGALALLLRRSGFWLPGILAAWIVALHPWYLRYGTEGRAYALLLLGVPVLLVLWLRALERGSWGRWASFGAVEMLILWSHVGMLYFAALLNAVTLLALAFLHRGTKRLGPQVARWLVASVAAAMVWCQLMVPNLVQLLAYLEGGTKAADASFLRQVLAFLFAGMPWHLGRESAYYLEVSDLARSHPPLFGLGVTTSLALLAAGFVRMLRAGRVRAVLACVLLGAAPLTFGMVWWREDRVFEWYLVAFLPLWVALVAVGVGWLATGAQSRLARSLGSAAALGWLVAFATWTHEPRGALREASVDSERESVALTRGTLDPFAPENDRVVTVSFYRPPTYYDPLLLWVEEPRDLRRLMQQADATGRALYVNVGRPALAERKSPELWQMVHDPALFEEVAELFGFDPRGRRALFRYRGEADG